MVAAPQWQIQYQPGTAQYYLEPLGNGVDLEMVLIPAGGFWMGSQPGEGDDDEQPCHYVRIARFFLGAFPVTQAQYQQVMGINPAEQWGSKFIAPDKPVVGVSWHDAVAFCQRLSQQTSRPYRLPSEAEWEYACRASPDPLTEGTPEAEQRYPPYHFGGTLLPELANFDFDVGATTAVGHYQAPNKFGLHDMHGNVWEWCADHWHRNYEEAPTDGSAWLTNNDNASRLLRGGSWGNLPSNCRSALRFRYLPDYQNSNLGFRVSCSAARTL